MPTLTYTRPHDLSQLHDELLAAIPALRPGEGQEPVLRVEGRGDEIRLTVPDGTDTAAIDAVVNAHTRKARKRPKQAHEYRAEWAGATQAQRQAIIARLLGIEPPDLVDDAGAP